MPLQACGVRWPATGRPACSRRPPMTATAGTVADLTRPAPPRRLRYKWMYFFAAVALGPATRQPEPRRP